MDVSEDSSRTPVSFGVDEVGATACMVTSSSSMPLRCMDKVELDIWPVLRENLLGVNGAGFESHVVGIWMINCLSPEALFKQTLTAVTQAAPALHAAVADSIKDAFSDSSVTLRGRGTVSNRTDSARELVTV